MAVLKKKNLSIILFLIPLSYVIGIALTEFFVFLGIIFFIILNKDKTLFKDPKINFLFMFSVYIFLNAYFKFWRI